MTARNTARDRWNDALDRYKARHAHEGGSLAVTLETQPQLAAFCAVWPRVRKDVRGKQVKADDPWSGLEVDFDTIAQAMGVGTPTAVAAFRALRDLGAIYPDGTLHHAVKEYLEARRQHAVAPPMVFGEEH